MIAAIEPISCNAFCHQHGQHQQGRHDCFVVLLIHNDMLHCVLHLITQICRAASMRVAPCIQCAVQKHPVQYQRLIDTFMQNVLHRLCLILVFVAHHQLATLTVLEHDNGADYGVT